MSHIDKIIQEEVKRLLEREAKNSVNAAQVINLAKKHKFLPINNANDNRIIFYYTENNYDNLNTNIQNLSDTLSRCGWTITNYGNHYDGLRNYYQRYQQEHPDFNIGTIFVIAEPDYGTPMDDYYGNEDNQLDNAYINDNQQLGTKYQRGIFYHITSRKYLKSIMAHGLRPKNGGGITRWRDTKPRLYLSLLPNFDDVDYNYDNEEEYEDDPILLKINLKPVMHNFKFYVDTLYENAVYTYESIPPQFIHVMDNDEISDIHSKYYVQKIINNALNLIINKNFQNCNDDEKKEKVYYYRYQIEELMYRNVTNSLKGYHINDKFKQNIRTNIINKIMEYCN